MPNPKGPSKGSDRRERDKDWVRVNHQIRVPEVRVIGEDGEPLGVMATKDAIKLAIEKELDLVEVAPNAQPPVCKIIEYGKYKYEKKQREKSAKKKVSKSTLKELKFRPKIGVHDINVRVKHARKFLLKGNRVRLVVRFRGREHSHPEIAEDLLMNVFKQLEDIADAETPRPRKEAATMIFTISPNQIKIAAYIKAQGIAKKEVAALQGGKGKDEDDLDDDILDEELEALNAEEEDDVEELDDDEEDLRFRKTFGET